MPQLIADRYELEETVGTGGMSTVYRAFDTLLERHVALKILHERYGDDEEYIGRFRREARAAARLSHPHIVTVIDRGEQDGKEFIVFELVEGENLKELVERGGRAAGSPRARARPRGRPRGRLRARARASSTATSSRRTCSSTRDGRAKVTDFGIARTIDAVGTTETGTVLGTSHYVAPEQARGEKVDAQTDVYSFGVVLWELLAGEVPYAGENFLTVAMQHVNEPVPSVLDRRPGRPAPPRDADRELHGEGSGRPAGVDGARSSRSCRPASRELDAKEGGEATMIVRRPVQKRARRPRARGRRGGRAFLLPLVAGLVLAVVVARPAADARRRRRRRRRRRGRATPVRLQGVGAFDPPPGDGEEHDDEAGLATDNDPGTFWRTESYRASLELIGKPGVGLVLDAGAPKKVDKLAVTTDTPGFTAEIRAGDSPDGPFETVGGEQTVAASTTWELDGADARYYVVWITELDGSAHVNEVKAS